MAGGRRPASYVAGARHNAGVERSATEFPNSPPAGATAGPSLPLWIPSIWQPSPTKPSMTSETSPLSSLPTRERTLRPDPSSALAAALDTAVQSAVVRALGHAAPTPSSPHIRSASTISDNGLEEGDAALWAARERELTDMVDSLQKRLDERNDDVRTLTDRLKALENRIDADADAARQREGRIVASMNAQISRLTTSIAEGERTVDAKVASLHEHAKTSQNAVAKLRSAQKGSEAELRSMKKWTQDIAKEMRQLEVNLCAEFDKCWCHVEQLGQSVNEAVSKGSDVDSKHDNAALEKELDELKRNVETTAETVTTTKSKMKRIEAQVMDAVKQSNDMLALNSGFEESIRDSLVKVTSVIDRLSASVAQLTKESATRGNTEDESDVQTRVDGLESNLKALKKLIESNLRTQWNAESIVKEQVSLITKHVCVAMRQYTARRISENNALIDQALRARVPEYAKNEDQFVLVREEDTEGNESIDIQRSSEVSSTASS